jgi:hypothetical protein
VAGDEDAETVLLRLPHERLALLSSLRHLDPGLTLGERQTVANAIGRVRRPKLPAAGARRLEGVRVAFYTSQLSERGTETALYDYADLLERQLGAVSYVVYNALSSANVPCVLARFRSRFGERCIGIDYRIELDPHLSDGGLLKRERITHLYTLKIGRATDDPPLCGLRGHVRTLVHAVFDGTSPHGDVYARISPSVPGVAPVVPHVVLPQQEAGGPDLRDELGIPSGATVFGRHGGRDTFDIGFVRDAIVKTARARPHDIYFVLMNTSPLLLVGDGECDDHSVPLPNLIHLEQTSDRERISAFVRTCDAMLHARSDGETFGLAISDFCAHGKPVLTSSEHHDSGRARFHLDTLGDRGLYYHDHPSLMALLGSFDRQAARQRSHDYWRQPYAAYEPGRVMRTFASVFFGGS